MAGRDRYLPSSGTPTSSSRIREAPDSNLNRVRSSVLLEDRIEIQHREIQTLLADNQRLAVSHVALKEELAAAKREIQRLLETASKVKAERDAQVREVYGRSLKLEAEARVIEVIATELDQVREDVEKLTVNKRELAGEMEGIEDELAKFKKDSQRATEIKAEIETVRSEIQKGRKAIELEKTTRASNLKHKYMMERNMGLLASEIEKLQADLVTAEERARTAAAAAAAPAAAGPTFPKFLNLDPEFGASYGNPEMEIENGPYTESYATHQVHGGDDLPQQPQAPGAAQHAPYNV